MVLGLKQDWSDIHYIARWESGLMKGAKARRLGTLSSLRLDSGTEVDRGTSELE